MMKHPVYSILKLDSTQWKKKFSWVVIIMTVFVETGIQFANFMYILNKTEN